MTLKSVLNGKYARVNVLDELVAEAETASTATDLYPPFAWSFERYELIENADGTVSFKAARNDRYVQRDLISSEVEAEGLTIGNREKFVKTSY